MPIKSVIKSFVYKLEEENGRRSHQVQTDILKILLENMFPIKRPFLISLMLAVPLIGKF